jgi:glycosyltransferase involved in cell wall biosynthesis
VTSSPPPDGPPDVSFLIACYNARAYLGDAVRSALGQAGATVEVIVVDDHSSDDSLAIAHALASTDRRVRVLQTPTNAGPAAARNLAIAAARGTWLAVLDADDLIEPQRSRRLIDAADASGADMIADDLMVFTDGDDRTGHPFLAPARQGDDAWIPIARYFAETRMYGPDPDLGFLKPMLRAAFVRTHDIRYDEALRIAEDDALIIRLLRAGARYRLLREPLYRYRKHGGSISHRLSVDHVDRMMAAGDALAHDLRADLRARAAYGKRHRALRRAWAFTHLIDALQRRRPLRAIGLAVRHPTVLPLLRMPIAGLARKLRHKQSA